MIQDAADTTSVVPPGPRQRQILHILEGGELSVTEITDQLPVSMAAVSQHLGKLKAAGLVSVRRDGRKRFYRCTAGPAGASRSGGPSGSPSASPPDSDEVTAPRARYAAPPSPSDGDRFDEMGSWYRQGLRGRVVALEAARTALATDPEGAAASIRRLAQSLTRPAIAERFPDVHANAESLAAAGSPDIEAQVALLIGSLRQVSVSDDAATVRILMVEDGRVEAQLYSSILRGPNREVLLAGSAEDARVILDREDVDLVLLDLGLPGADGRELLIELGRRPRTAAIPVILLTGRTDALTQTEAMSLGADAFYSKPVASSVISTAVSMMLERAAESRQLGRSDPLTGLRNRTVFLDDVRRIAATAIRADVALSLAIIDLHGLSVVNDLHGSEVGDDVVRAMGGILHDAFRASDLVARWEGSQFATLFWHAAPPGAAIALEKLAELTDRHPLTLPDGSEQPLRWRAGVASIGEPASIDEALARATRRLQAARRSRRQSVIWEDTPAEDRTPTVLVIEDDEIVADLVEHRLRREKFDVMRFSDGAEALAALPNVDASAVVLDTTLPGADGFEILRRLQDSPSLSGVPVVVLTFGGEHDTSRALRLGARDSIPKPFSVEELVARVARLVREFEDGSV